MKRLLIALTTAGVLAACSSTVKDEQKSATVEDRKPSVSQPTQSQTGPSTAPVQSQSTSGNPLRDPNNILSKRTVFFDYDQFTVKDEFRPLVSAHAKYLSSSASTRVTVQGNTDERGSREYNLALGQKRADAVKQMMVLSGAPSQNIETVSFGEEKPRAQGNNEQAYAENRRADIVYAGE
jgi:peptidoglycan-associated lipoprotein